MVAIYIAASALSSLSLLVCDHHHPFHQHHHEHHHDASCSCSGDTLIGDCCNHVHPVLGENHTDYITSTKRGDTRLAEECNIVVDYALLASVISELPYIEQPLVAIGYGDEQKPLQAAFLSAESLRAPPYFA